MKYFSLKPFRIIIPILMICMLLYIIVLSGVNRKLYSKNKSNEPVVFSLDRSISVKTYLNRYLKDNETLLSTLFTYENYGLRSSRVEKIVFGNIGDYSHTWTRPIIMVYKNKQWTVLSLQDKEFDNHEWQFVASISSKTGRKRFYAVLDNGIEDLLDSSF